MSFRGNVQLSIMTVPVNNTTKAWKCNCGDDFGDDFADDRSNSSPNSSRRCNFRLQINFASHR